MWLWPAPIAGARADNIRNRRGCFRPEAACRPRPLFRTSLLLIENVARESGSPHVNVWNEVFLTNDRIWPVADSSSEVPLSRVAPLRDSYSNTVSARLHGRPRPPSAPCACARALPRQEARRLLCRPDRPVGLPKAEILAEEHQIGSRELRFSIFLLLSK